MTVKTIYICDKCGSEQDSSKQFWTVGVTATCSIHPDPHGYRRFVEDKYLQVCRPCLESFGIHVQTRPEHKDNPPQIPTIEELIREIVERCS